MARGARVALARCPHHIVQRGHNRRIVFVTNGDRQSYLETLAEFRWHFYIPAYVKRAIELMDRPMWETYLTSSVIFHLAFPDEDIGMQRYHLIDSECSTNDRLKL
jgi:hypothetical protein